MIPKQSRFADFFGMLQDLGSKKPTKRLLALVLVAILGACAGGNSAPVAEQGERQQRNRPVIVDSRNSSNAVLRADSNPVRIVDSQGSTGVSRAATSIESARALPATAASGSAAIVRPASPAAASAGTAIQRGGISRQSIGRSSLPPAGRPLNDEVDRVALPATNERVEVATPAREPSRTQRVFETAAAHEMPSSYRVRSGDTLYSIAFQHDLDYRRLAAANRLAAPYTIFVNQLISLDVSAEVAAPAPVSSVSSRGTQVSSAPAAVEQAPVLSWVWPLEGRVVEEFSLGRNKGIDIAGSQGDSVVAASAGDVVFSGRSVQGAGDLIIIRHNDRVLSAYAHNSAMSVSVGDRVTAGQKIAEVGLDPTGAPLLHFEIRRAGDSVDPRGYLP